MKKAAFILLFPVLFLIAGTTHAQAPPDFFTRLETKTPGAGFVTVTQDDKIRNMVNLHLAQQRRINGIKGYKISIYRGSGQETRRDAELTMSKFLSKYETVICERKFEYPNWKVYVGAFRTKSDALKFLKLIEYDYPDAFIREDIVSFPD